MFEFENNSSYNSGNPGASESGGERSGEYAYSGGFARESIYSDAHYSPAGQGAVPPRYYTPPQKQEKPRKTQRSGSAGRVIRTICLCLICAMLGGLIGAGAMGFGCQSASTLLRAPAAPPPRRMRGPRLKTPRRRPRRPQSPTS